MGRLIYIWLFVVLLAIPCIVAVPELYYKIDDVIDVNVPCFNDGALCSGVTSCNISINDPTSTSLVGNELMSNKGSFHNFSFSPTILGDYQTIVSCRDGNESASTTFTFQVNNIGREIENFLGVVVFLVLMVLVSLIITVLLIASDNILMYPSILVTSGSVTILFFFMYMFSIGLSGVFYAFYWSFLLVSLCTLFFVLWELTLKYLNEWSKSAKKRNDFKDDF